MASRTKAKVILFGESGEADVRAENVRLTDSGQPAFRLHTPSGASEVTMRLYGEHHVSNALAAAAVAHELGMSVAEIATALSEAGSLSRWRMEVTERPEGLNAAVLNLAPDHLDWHGSMEAVRRRQGPYLRGQSGRLRLQRRRQGHRGPGA
ncbi:UDP-N-acetylmuramoyl-L-alanyl-D-glutamate--2,6-diaminopimelate ligase [Streptomyces alboniger]